MTRDAQKVDFEWFFDQMKDKSDQEETLANLLGRFMSALNSDGNCGNVFEDFLSTKLTMLGCALMSGLSFLFAT
jgi:hypothetical protein